MPGAAVATTSMTPARESYQTGDASEPLLVEELRQAPCVTGCTLVSNCCMGSLQDIIIIMVWKQCRIPIR